MAPLAGLPRYQSGQMELTVNQWAQ
ncbi:MAG: hypothetical protein ACD_24C00082G0001, partial [uncultured bacterium]